MGRAEVIKLLKSQFRAIALIAATAPVLCLASPAEIHEDLNLSDAKNFFRNFGARVRENPDGTKSVFLVGRVPAPCYNSFRFSIESTPILKNGEPYIGFRIQDVNGDGKACIQKYENVRCDRRISEEEGILTCENLSDIAIDVGKNTTATLSLFRRDPDSDPASGDALEVFPLADQHGDTIAIESEASILARQAQAEAEARAKRVDDLGSVVDDCLKSKDPEDVEKALKAARQLYHLGSLSLEKFETIRSEAAKAKLKKLQAQIRGAKAEKLDEIRDEVLEIGEEYEDLADDVVLVARDISIRQYASGNSAGQFSNEGLEKAKETLELASQIEGISDKSYKLLEDLERNQRIGQARLLAMQTPSLAYMYRPEFQSLMIEAQMEALPCHLRLVTDFSVCGPALAFAQNVQMLPSISRQAEIQREQWFRQMTQSMQPQQPQQPYPQNGQLGGPIGAPTPPLGGMGGGLGVPPMLPPGSIPGQAPGSIPGMLPGGGYPPGQPGQIPGLMPYPGVPAPMMG